MKNKLIIYLKSALKASAILSLAVFQVSFFLKSETSTSAQRHLAQVSELGRGGNVDLSVLNTEDTEPVTIQRTKPSGDPAASGDTVDFVDIIPDKLPPQEKVKEALKNYDLKILQCVVPKDDAKEIESIRAEFNNAREDNNKNAANKAFKDISEKLVALGLLEKRTSNTSDDDILNFDMGGSSKISSRSIFLNEENPEDLKLILECHLQKLNNLPSKEEQAEYARTHILNKNVNAILEALKSSPQDVQQLIAQLVNNTSIATDTIGNQYGYNQVAFVHAQAALAINPMVADLQNLQKRLALNPNDPTLQMERMTKINALTSKLSEISTQATNMALMDQALISDPNALTLAKTNIEQAVLLWGNEVDNILQGGQSNLIQIQSTPSSAAGSLVGLQPSIYGNIDNNILLGAGAANLDPTNVMTMPTQRILDANIRPEMLSPNLVRGNNRPMVNGTSLPQSGLQPGSYTTPSAPFIPSQQTTFPGTTTVPAGTIPSMY